MKPYELRMQDRFGLLPEQIKQLTHDNALIHAGVFQWLDTDKDVEWLLTNLVAVQAQIINELETKLVECMNSQAVR